jgi:hypothetical protein
MGVGNRHAAAVSMREEEQMNEREERIAAMGKRDEKIALGRARLDAAGARAENGRDLSGAVEEAKHAIRELEAAIQWDNESRVPVQTIASPLS